MGDDSLWGEALAYNHGVPLYDEEEDEEEDGEEGQPVHEEEEEEEGEEEGEEEDMRGGGSWGE